MEKKHLSGFRVFLVSLLLLNLTVSGQELNFTELKSSQDWQKAKSDANSSGKDIFLDIYASWCGPCKMMDANVYTNPKLAEYYNANYINLKVDGESEFGEELASLYKLTAFPSLYFINSEEVLIYEAIGYRDAEQLISSGENVKNSGKRYLELLSLMKSASISKEESKELLDLVVKFENKFVLGQLSKELIAGFTEVDILNPENKAVIMAVGGDVNSEPVLTVMKNPDTLKIIWGVNEFNQYLSEVFNVSMQQATGNADEELMEKIAMEFVPVYMADNTERISEAQLTTRKIYFAETGNWESYIKAVEKYKEEFQKENPRFLYLESYYIIENQIFEPILLDKANEWLSQVITLQPDFESYFLCAIVNTYREDTEAAKKWMNMAESVALTEDERDSLSELKRYMEE